jgi:hypothetical protein
MIVEIFIPQGKVDNSFGYQEQDTMLYALFITIIGEALGKTLKNAGTLFSLSQKQTTSIGSDSTSTEISDYFSSSQRLK